MSKFRNFETGPYLHLELYLDLNRSVYLEGHWQLYLADDAYLVLVDDEQLQGSGANQNTQSNKTPGATETQGTATPEGIVSNLYTTI